MRDMKYLEEVNGKRKGNNMFEGGRNDIEKAIDALKLDNYLMEFDPSTGEKRPIEAQNELNQYVYKANLLAISALEKQMPKKPNKVFNGIKSLVVCECGAEIYMFSKGFKGCPYCLQAIDWGKEEIEEGE